MPFIPRGFLAQYICEYITFTDLFCKKTYWDKLHGFYSYTQYLSYQLLPNRNGTGTVEKILLKYVFLNLLFITTV